MEVSSFLTSAVAYTPCKPGYVDINCKQCSEGTQKLSMFETFCQKCDPNEQTSPKKIFSEPNNCQKYTCNKARVHLTQEINKYCMTSYEVFSSILVKHYDWLLYSCAALVLIITLGSLNRKYTLVKCFRQKNKTPKTDFECYESRFVVFSFQGENLPENQWFLEVEISKDYNSSVFPKQDYLTIVRELNAISKWKKKQKIIYSLVCRFLSPLEEKYLKKYRKKIFESMRQYIADRNNHKDEEKEYNLELWVSDDFSAAQLIVKLRKKSNLVAQPIPIQFTGLMTMDCPLEMQVNPALLQAHLMAHFKGDVTKVEKQLQDLRKAIFELKKGFRNLYLHDLNLFFCNNLYELLDKMDTFNEGLGHKIDLRMNFVVIEQLKVKYQKQKFRYNQMYHLKTKNIKKIQLFREKLLEFQTRHKMFTYQFMLFLTPSLKLGELQQLTIEKEETNNTQMMGIKNYSYGQSGLITDLGENPELLEKFIKSKSAKSLVEVVSGTISSLGLIFTNPDPLDLSRFERYLLKLVLMAAVAIDWVDCIYFSSCFTPS